MAEPDHDILQGKETPAGSEEDDYMNVSHEPEYVYDSDGKLWITIYSDGLKVYRNRDKEMAEANDRERIMYKKLDDFMVAYWENLPAGRNTKNVPGKKKVRTWCFTLNNYTQDEIVGLVEAFKGLKYVFQEETGDNGTPHLQGVVSYKNQVYLSHCKEINGRAHWEVCRNTSAARAYCRKEETRSGEVYSNL